MSSPVAGSPRTGRSTSRVPGRARRAEASWLLVALLSLAACTVLFVSRARGRIDSPALERTVEHEPPAEAPTALAVPAPRAGVSAARERVAAGIAPADATSSVAPDPARAISAPTLTLPASPPGTGLLEVLVRERGVASAATIELGHSAPGSERETVTVHACGADGGLRLALPPGSLRAVAWSERATALPAFVDLAAGARSTLALELEPALPVAGRVLDARTGAPLAGASVSFWTFSEEDRVRTAADGSFEHPRFPARAPAQQMRVAAEGFGPSVRYLALEDDGRWELAPRVAGEAPLAGHGTPWLEIALLPELAVAGRVLDPEGRPIAGASVAAEGFYHVRPAVASRDEARALTDEHGTFRLAGLRSDVGHSLLVGASGFALLELELGSGPALDLGALVLARETVLSGSVVDGAGLPVEDIEVVLARTDPAPDSARIGALDAGVRLQGRELVLRTGAEGAFLFEHLEPRAYRISVRRERDAWIEETLEPQGGRFEDLVLVLPGEALALEGTVQDGGRPAARVTVELRRAGTVARTTTDAGGGFRIAGLDGDAPYEIEATRTRSGVVWRSSASAWAFERPELELESSGPGLARVGQR